MPPGRLIFQKSYMNENFPTFKAALQHFLTEAGVSKPPLTACFAVAGPVTNNTVSFTNRKEWSINGADIARTFRIKVVKLVNDFVAVGYGLLTLQEDTECETLQNAPKVPGAPIACIGAGTGLGECFLALGPNNQYVCYPTEGGHTEFAPRSQLEIRLLAFLLKKFNSHHRVSVERVVSGIGLYNIYEFLAEDMPEKVDPTLHQQIENAGELKGKIIATNTQNELCQTAMSIFAGAYGSEAGVAGLKWLPQGGLYITGGLTPKNIDLIRQPDGPFLHAFKDKGRVSFVLDSIPMYAVMIDDVGQRGAHRVAYLDYYTETTPQTPREPPKPASLSDGGSGSPYKPILGLAAIVSLTFYAIARYR